MILVPTEAIIIHNLVETNKIADWNDVSCTIIKIEEIKNYYTDVNGNQRYKITNEFDLEYDVNGETILSTTSFGATLGYNVK